MATKKTMTVKQSVKAIENKLGIITPKVPRKAPRKAKVNHAANAIKNVNTGLMVSLKPVFKAALPALVISPRTRHYTPTIVIGEASKLANNQVVIEPAKPTKVNFATYGHRIPNEGTSAFTIWVACKKLGVNENSVTKVKAFEIEQLALTFVDKKGETKAVNRANISIEINSYKKYIKFIAGQTANTEKLNAA